MSGTWCLAWSISPEENGVLGAVVDLPSLGLESNLAVIIPQMLVQALFLGCEKGKASMLQGFQK